MTPPVHGVDGWVLVEFQRLPGDVGEYLYERRINGVTELRVCQRQFGRRR